MVRRTLTLLAALAAVTARVVAQAATCSAPDAAARLDHAIVVVRDIDAAAGRFAPLGFRFKLGRLHADSLLNRHIKFRDGTGLEFMTLAGRPTSRMAREYRELLDAREGGVYAALWTTDIERARTAAARFGSPRLTQLGAWQFLSVPSAPETHAIFFGAGGYPANDPDSVVAHPNGAQRLAAAWIEGGPTLERLLGSLGSHACGNYRLPDGRVGVRWALAGGSLVVIPDSGRRLVGVEIERAQSGAASLSEPLRGFWVLLR
jgi:hypothetical protein